MECLDFECSSHVFPSALFLIKPESNSMPFLELSPVLTHPSAHLPPPVTHPSPSCPPCLGRHLSETGERGGEKRRKFRGTTKKTSPFRSYVCAVSPMLCHGIGRNIEKVVVADLITTPGRPPGPRHLGPRGASSDHSEQTRSPSSITTPAQRALPVSGVAPPRPSASSYGEVASWAGASSRAARRRCWGCWRWCCCRRR